MFKNKKKGNKNQYSPDVDLLEIAEKCWANSFERGRIRFRHATSLKKNKKIEIRK